MRWYRAEYARAGWMQCWLIMVQLDRRARDPTLGRVLYIDHTCWPGDRHRARIQDVERRFRTRFPGLWYSKYYNVPIVLGVEGDGEENYLKGKYFDNLDLLEGVKTKFDPNGLFDQFQGLRAKTQDTSLIDHTEGITV